MKKWIVTAIAFLVGIAAYVAWPEKARCAYCPTYTCYGSCPGKCVCVTPPGKSGGQCWSVE